MAKELTHILIATDVLKRLKGSGQQLLAQVIHENLPAFYLGAIIPDAFFYDVFPFRLNPKKYIRISRSLHLKETADNDQKAMSFFRSIAINPCAWSLKLAFSAGIITHTVADRIFHEDIEYYTTTWEETGAIATATHREIETLIDLIFLRAMNTSPRRFRLGSFIQLDERAKYCLFRFYLTHLINEAHHAPDPGLLNALNRAHRQQRLCIDIFAIRPIYHTMKLLNKFTANRLRVWHSLFYPDKVKPQSFPVLGKFGLNSLSDEGAFIKGLKDLREAVTTDAIQHINIALKRFA